MKWAGFILLGVALAVVIAWAINVWFINATAVVPL